MKKFFALMGLVTIAASSAMACGVAIQYDPATRMYGAAQGDAIYDVYSAQIEASARCVNCSSRAPMHWAAVSGPDAEAWVALAASPSGHWGVSVAPDNDSEYAAEDAALRNCPAADCQIVRSLGVTMDYYSGACVPLEGQKNSLY